MTKTIAQELDDETWGEKPEPRQVLREAPGYVQICPYCKKEIPTQMVQQGGCHMHCYNTEIDVWFISLPDAPNHGFYESGPDQVMEQLKSAEHNAPYLIQRKMMLAGRYYNLKEFDGF